MSSHRISRYLIHLAQNVNVRIDIYPLNAFTERPGLGIDSKFECRRAR